MKRVYTLLFILFSLISAERSFSQITRFVGQTTVESLTRNIGCPSGNGSNAYWDGPVGGTISDAGGSTTTFTVNWTSVGTFKISRTFTGCTVISTVYTVTPPNTPPGANAGSDLTLILPLNKTVLNGSGFDSDGSITTYSWRKVSGPPVVVTKWTNPVLKLWEMTAGTYVFGLRVTDNYNAQSSEDLVTVTVSYPPNNYTYLRKTDVLIKDQTTQSQVSQLAIGQKSVVTNYMDGLGRDMQTVITQGSPLKRDLVQPYVYDEFGRAKRQYLPVVVDETNGAFKNNTDIIDNVSGNYKGIAGSFYAIGSVNQIADDTKPFSETVFESSPLDKVDKIFGAGSVWSSSGNNKFVQTQQFTNVHDLLGSLTSEKIIAWKIVAGNPERDMAVNNGSGYYATGNLLITVTTDEEGATVRKYNDKNGRTILKKVQVSSTVSNLNDNAQWALTYYLYDDWGNLLFALQPELNATLLASDISNPTTSSLASQAFQYQYDSRQRLVVKKEPGVDPIYIIYDKLNRVVLSQTGNQRKDSYGVINKKEWTFNKYDNVGRLIMSGIYTHNSVVDRNAMADLVSSTVFFETYNGSAANHGYTNNVFPTVNILPLEVTYHDNYRFKTDLAGTSYGYVNGDIVGQEAQENTEVLGQVTGMKSNILGTANYLWSINFYDQHGRILQVKKQNHKGGIDRTTNLYDFVRLRETKITHTFNTTTYTIHRKFDYDDAGRLLTVRHKFHNDPDFVIISENGYNELGQAVQKKLHSRNAGPFSQKVDYEYNIRGWLKKINDPTSPEVSDLFSIELKYHDPSTNGGSANFNGNISQSIWKTVGLGSQSYAFEYDPMNRLIEAEYYDADHSINNNNFTEKIGDPLASTPVRSYDLNGNIYSLFRYGKRTDEYGLIDQLTYSLYNGNQFAKVDDAVLDSDDPFGFKDKVKTNSEYSYDANGNLTKDDNKGITSIEYNYLNLPSKVSRSVSEYVVYTYNAHGQKLSQQVFGTTPKITDYISEFVYENNSLRLVNHEEGRIVPDNSPNAPRPFEYQYFLKDHLGNVRVIFSEKKTTSVTSATFEDATQSQEQANFKNYHRSPIIYGNHTPGAGNTYSQLLNGKNQKAEVGLAKSFVVESGDIFDLEVYAKYEAPGETDIDTDALITSLVSAFSLGANTSPMDGAQAQTKFNQLFSAGPIITDDQLEDELAPKAYLNYILFDQNFGLIDFGFDQVDIDAKFIEGTPVLHDYLSLHVKVQQKGYLYVYLSNEQPVETKVYFDDLQITKQSGIEQLNDYYPFGLTFNSFSKNNSVPGMYQFNGKEKQDEMDLGWVDYGARMYMPDLGRFSTVDDKAHNYMMYSPYGYAANNPVNNVDFNGDFILPKEFLDRFQRLAQYLAHDIQGILGNRRIVNALKKHGGFTDKQLKEAFTWGRGPTIDAGEFESPFVLGVTGGVPGDIAMVINIDLFEALESAEGKERDYILFLTAVTILHEFVHYGYIDNKVTNETLEEGLDFERDAYGEVVNKNTYRRVMDKWLKTYNEEKKQAEEESEKKAQSFNNLINNFSNLAGGTYTWNGTAFVIN